MDILQEGLERENILIAKELKKKSRELSELMSKQENQAPFGTSNSPRTRENQDPKVLQGMGKRQ